MLWLYFIEYAPILVDVELWLRRRSVSYSELSHTFLFPLEDIVCLLYEAFIDMQGRLDIRLETQRQLVFVLGEGAESPILQSG